MILLFLLIVLVPTAWAGDLLDSTGRKWIEDSPGRYHSADGRATLSTVDEVTIGEPRMTLSDDCEAMMEAAMRAMEPYIVVGKRFRFVQSSGQEYLEIYIENKESTLFLFNASKQWADAKRDCWRQP